ncbi:hypothetical protein COC46_01740 [Bacillus sp. AFS041924]|nr:hypothetical protein COC46_01740 [Bacillus sp. AFS041924]
MNKNGRLSIMMVGISLVISFFINEHTKHLGIFLILFCILSLTGIMFAFLSKKITIIIFGTVLNILTFIFFFFLVLAFNFGEV